MPWASSKVDPEKENMQVPEWMPSDDPAKQLDWLREYLILNRRTIGVNNFAVYMLRVVLARCALRRVSAGGEDDSTMDEIQAMIEGRDA